MECPLRKLQLIHLPSGEEVLNAGTVVPWSMIAGMIISGAFTFAFSIALLFGIGDLSAALSTPTAFPIIQIFRTATQSNRATNAMTAALISSLILSNLGLVASASRLTWTFARDKGLPFSSYLSHVSNLISDTQWIAKWVKANESSPLG